MCLVRPTLWSQGQVETDVFDCLFLPVLDYVLFLLPSMLVSVWRQVVWEVKDDDKRVLAPSPRCTRCTLICVAIAAFNGATDGVDDWFCRSTLTAPAVGTHDDETAKISLLVHQKHVRSEHWSTAPLSHIRREGNARTAHALVRVLWHWHWHWQNIPRLMQSGAETATAFRICFWGTLLMSAIGDAEHMKRMTISMESFPSGLEISAAWYQ